MVAGLRSGANGLRAALRGLTGARGACWHRGTSHREGSCRWAMGGTAPAWGSFLQRLRVLRCSSTAGCEEQCPQGVVLPGFGAGGQAACCWWAAAQPGSCCETLRSFFFLLPGAAGSTAQARHAAQPAPTPAGPAAGGGCSPGGCQTAGSPAPGAGLKTQTGLQIVALM